MATKRFQMHPNCTNRRKHKFRVQWGGSGAFVAKNSDATFVRQPNGLKCTQIVQNAPKHQFRVQWHWMCSLRKIPPRLRGTNFCISSARCAPSFVRQPNGPECTQIVRNTPKHQFRVQWGGWGVFVAKNSTRLCGMNFWTNSARFASGFVWQSNGLEWTQIVRNAPKCLFSVQWGGLGAFVEKNSDATSWHELLH